MSLDVAILGDDGRPEAEIHISARIHGALMSRVMQSESPLLARMSDYYGDVDYATMEVALLLDELVRLHDDVLHDTELNLLVEELILLAKAAVRVRTGLAVIAD